MNYLKIKLAVILTFTSILSCTIFKETVKLSYLIEKKQEMDETENPAKSRLIREDLNNKIIEINDLVVKNIIASMIIDYDYCVTADVEIDGKLVEFYIYSNDIKTLAKLKKGESVIDIRGIFGKFFTMLDDYYTKIEILNASIKIKNDTN